MHLLRPQLGELDDLVEPVDLGQPPGDIVVLVVCGQRSCRARRGVRGGAGRASERAARASARPAPSDVGRSLGRRVGAPRQGDRGAAARRARLVALRRRAARRVARERGIALAVLPGEDRDDTRLAEASTLPADDWRRCSRYFREGGRENMRALLRRLAGHAGRDARFAEPQAVPRGRLSAGRGRGGRSMARRAALAPGRPGGADHLLSLGAARRRHRADRCAVRGACCAGLAPAPLVVPSLKDAQAASSCAARSQRLGRRSSSPRRRSPPAARRASPLDGVTRRCCRR